MSLSLGGDLTADQITDSVKAGLQNKVESRSEAFFFR